MSRSANLPKIVFKEMTCNENVDLIEWAYFEKDKTLDLHDFITQYFPDLASLDPDLPRTKIHQAIQKAVSTVYAQNQEKLKSAVAKYDSLWKSYNDKYFEALSSYLNIDWPSNLKEITATVGLIPVFPRNLDDFSFAIGVDIDNSKCLQVCAHETLHFLWFKKWRQMHPETPREEYDSPYLAWKYSEMVTDPILNDKPFSEMFNFEERGYDSFYLLKDSGKKVMEKLREIYSADLSIEEKIDAGFQYISRLL